MTNENEINQPTPNDWKREPSKRKWNSVIAEIKTSQNEYQEYMKLWKPEIPSYLNEHEFYCGIDVHKNNWRAAIYGLDRIHFSDPILGPVCMFTTDIDGREALIEMLTYFKVKRILMEVSGVYVNPIYDLLTAELPDDLMADIYVMNPRLIPKDLSQIRKTDKTDAMKLSRLASRKENLSRCYIAPREERAMRALCRYQKKLTQEKNRYENRLKGNLASIGCVFEFSFKSAYTIDFFEKWFNSDAESLIDFLEELEICGENKLIDFMGGKDELLSHWRFLRLSGLEKMVNLLYLGRIKSNYAELDLLEQRISDSLRYHEHYGDLYDRIQDIPGIGAINGAIIAVESGTFSRFRSNRQYQAYCGLAPKVFQTGNTLRMGTSYKMCNKRLKFAFKQAAMWIVNSIIRFPSNVDQTRSPLFLYAKRLSEKEPKYLKRVHKVASKISRIVYSMAKFGSIYAIANHSPSSGVQIENDIEVKMKFKRLEKELKALKGKTLKIIQSRYNKMPETMVDAYKRIDELSDSLSSEVKRVERRMLIEIELNRLNEKILRNTNGGDES
jgi:transposase